MFEPLPQRQNVRFEGGTPLRDANVKAAIADGEARLAGTAASSSSPAPSP
jgi:phosphoglucosamine mutase